MYPMPRTVSSGEPAIRPRSELVPQARDERLDRVGRDLFVKPVQDVGNHRFADHRPRPAHEQFEQLGFLVGQRNLGIMVVQAARRDVEGQVADMELRRGARPGAAQQGAQPGGDLAAVGGIDEAASAPASRLAMRSQIPSQAVRTSTGRKFGLEAPPAEPSQAVAVGQRKLQDYRVIQDQPEVGVGGRQGFPARSQRKPRSLVPSAIDWARRLSSAMTSTRIQYNRSWNALRTVRRAIALPPDSVTKNSRAKLT